MKNSDQNKGRNYGSRNSWPERERNNSRSRFRNKMEDRDDTGYDDYQNNYVNYEDNDDDYQRLSSTRNGNYERYGEDPFDFEYSENRGRQRNVNYGRDFFERRNDGRPSNNYGGSNNYGYGSNYRGNEYGAGNDHRYDNYEESYVNYSSGDKCDPNYDPRDNYNAEETRDRNSRGSWGGRLDSNYDGEREAYTSDFEDEYSGISKKNSINQEYNSSSRRNSEGNSTHRYQNENAGNISDLELSGRSSRRSSSRSRNRRRF